MLTIEQTKKFLELRKEGHSLEGAKRMAAAAPVSPAAFEWRDTNDVSLYTATHEEETETGEVEVYLRIVHEHHPDLSHLGEWSSVWKPGAENWHAFTGVPAHSRRHIMEWFIPCFTYDEIVKAHGDLSKGDANLKARAQVRDDMRLMKSIEDGDTMCVGILAEVIVNGNTVGEDSCWGMILDPSSDAHWAYINGEASNVMRSAVAEATADVCPHCRGSGRTDDASH